MCQRIKLLLYDYTKGELSKIEIDMVKSHLEKCNACRKEMVFLEKIKSSIRQELLEPSDKILYKIKKINFENRLINLPVFFKPLIAFAVLVIFLVGFIYFGNLIKQGKTDKLDKFYQDIYDISVDFNNLS
ncbi:MAG: zf-HC2 domain-containing protein [Candidatus Goldbacteria bacterium]|nr:zf-HC2 domain-containing protein [Candidatus Goldiibacteriota bacterium]